MQQCRAVPYAADIVHVPGDASSIQHAIDQAVEGDTVVVGAGVWHETINLKGKGIVLRSAEARRRRCWMAGGCGKHRALRRGESVDQNRGIHPAGGNGDPSIHGPGNTVGGGSADRRLQPDHQQLLFKDNTSELQGGGGLLCS